MVGITVSEDEEEDLGGEEHSDVDSLDPLVWTATRWPPAGASRDSESLEWTNTWKSLALVWPKNPVTARTRTSRFIRGLLSKGLYTDI